MLKSLNIINLAVIHRLNVELSNGLCLLTGETGAGKSIIVDALGLLLGRRGRGTDPHGRGDGARRGRLRSAWKIEGARRRNSFRGGARRGRGRGADHP